MTRTFGLTLVVAIILGYIFPYPALALAPYGFVALFILMLLAGFSIEKEKLKGVIKQPRSLLVGVALCFVFVPSMMAGLASVLIPHEKFYLGFLFASMMPIALVAPFFVEKAGGDEELAYALMVITTLLAPFLTPFLLYFYAGSELPIRILPLILSGVVFVLVPVFITFLLEIYFPKIRTSLKSKLPILNSLALGVLVFVLFGSVVHKINLSYYSLSSLVVLMLLAVFQDFGIYFVLRFLLRSTFDERTVKAIVISVSMKNVAISAGIMLFYEPLAAFPSALVFIAHTAFFSCVVTLSQKVLKRRQFRSS